jgi:hypothetical protein
VGGLREWIAMNTIALTRSIAKPATRLTAIAPTLPAASAKLLSRRPQDETSLRAGPPRIILVALEKLKNLKLSEMELTLGYGAYAQATQCYIQ